MKKIIPIVLIVFLASCFSGYCDDNKVGSEGKLSKYTIFRDDTAYISIYGGIVWDDDVKLFNDLVIIKHTPKIKKIKVFMNSLGGSAYAGFSMADLFLRFKKKYDIEVYASGVIASVAVIVFASLDKRYAGENTHFLVHQLKYEPMQQLSLKHEDIKTMDNLFNILQERYLNFLSKRANKITIEEWKDMLISETWFSAKKAFDTGLVTEIK